MQLTPEELITTSAYGIICGLEISDAIALWKKLGLQLPAKYAQVNMLDLGPIRSKVTGDDKVYMEYATEQMKDYIPKLPSIFGYQTRRRASNKNWVQHF